MGRTGFEVQHGFEGIQATGHESVIKFRRRTVRQAGDPGFMCGVGVQQKCQKVGQLDEIGFLGILRQRVLDQVADIPLIRRAVELT